MVIYRVVRREGLEHPGRMGLKVLSYPAVEFCGVKALMNKLLT